jgi:hypothetical protein
MYRKITDIWPQLLGDSQDPVEERQQEESQEEAS